MKVGMAEMAFMALVILVVGGPVILKLAKKLGGFLSRRLKLTNRFRFLEQAGEELGRTIRMVVILLVVFVVLFGLAVYINMNWN